MRSTVRSLTGAGRMKAVWRVWFGDEADAKDARGLTSHVAPPTAAGAR